MKNRFKLFSYIFFTLLIMICFGYKVDAAIERECIYQADSSKIDGMSSTKVRFLNSWRESRALILSYKNTIYHNPEGARFQNPSEVVDRVRTDKKCPPYALIIKQGVGGYSVYVAFNRDYLKKVAADYKDYVYIDLISESEEGTLTDHNPEDGNDNIIDPGDDNDKDKDKDKEEEPPVTENNDLCELEIIDDLQKAWRLIQIVAPILVVIFGSIDYAQAVISQDNDAIKKATSRFSKRLLCAVAIFFLPWFINYIFDASGLDKTITNAVCGIK